MCTQQANFLDSGSSWLIHMVITALGFRRGLKDEGLKTLLAAIKLSFW